MAARKTTKIATSEPVKDVFESEFSKKQLLVAKRFRDRQDLLDAVLSYDKTYTVKAVEEIIENYLKGKVN